MISHTKYIILITCLLLFSMHGRAFYSTIYYEDGVRHKKAYIAKADSNVSMYVQAARFALENDEPSAARIAVESGLF